MLLTPISASTAWRGDRLREFDGFVYSLSSHHIEEPEALRRRFIEDDPDLRSLQAAEYPLDETKEAVRARSNDLDIGAHVYSS